MRTAPIGSQEAFVDMLNALAVFGEEINAAAVPPGPGHAQDAARPGSNQNTRRPVSQLASKRIRVARRRSFTGAPPLYRYLPQLTYVARMRSN